MQRLTLLKGPIQWPHCCASCEGEAAHTASSTCSVVTDVGEYVVVQTTTLHYTTITYPVCSRHRLLSRVAGIIAARNLLNLGVGVVWTFMVFGVLVGVYQFVSGQPVEWGMLSIFTPLVLLGIGLFVFGRRCTPVKITNATDSTVTLLFQNDSYANRFIDANQDLLVTEGR